MYELKLQIKKLEDELAKHQQNEKVYQQQIQDLKNKFDKNLLEKDEEISRPKDSSQIQLVQIKKSKDK
jgi:hypothetical protein